MQFPHLPEMPSDLRKSRRGTQECVRHVDYPLRALDNESAFSAANHAINVAA
jgi:hypothetical protein